MVARTMNIYKNLILLPDFVYNPKNFSILELVDLHLTGFQGIQVAVPKVYQTFMSLPGNFTKNTAYLLGTGLPKLVKITNNCHEFIYENTHGFGSFLNPHYIGSSMSLD